jgi:Phosphotransferase enzyme family
MADTNSDAPTLRYMRASELANVLVRTGTADIIALDEQWVVKLYRRHFNFQHVLQEYRLTRTAQQVGLAVPGMQDQLVESIDEGRYGICFARVHALNIADTLTAKPWLALSMARCLALEHRRVHVLEAPVGLMHVRARMRQQLGQCGVLGTARRAALERMLEGQKEGTSFCHGDFHWQNVLLAAQGPVTIDWRDACQGPSLWDVARTWVVLRFNDICRDPFLTAYCRFFAHCYLRAYLRHGQLPRAELARWRVLNAASRLSECSEPATVRSLLHYIDAGLARWPSAAGDAFETPLA